jgi:hypothetical protein
LYNPQQALRQVRGGNSCIVHVCPMHLVYWGVCMACLGPATTAIVAWACTSLRRLLARHGDVGWHACDLLGGTKCNSAQLLTYDRIWVAVLRQQQSCPVCGWPWERVGQILCSSRQCSMMVSDSVSSRSAHDAVPATSCGEISLHTPDLYAATANACDGSDVPQICSSH